MPSKDKFPFAAPTNPIQSKSNFDRSSRLPRVHYHPLIQFQSQPTSLAPREQYQPKTRCLHVQACHQKPNFHLQPPSAIRGLVSPHQAVRPGGLTPSVVSPAWSAPLRPHQPPSDQVSTPLAPTISSSVRFFMLVCQ